ncbi:hypothetical protein DRQ25_04330 [Candidatus Fermentibacteria bacterium]|nr:MAG: hypothetical protein DRQ25_04330 [Candidatus Fermentibacteria bacterium]
MGDTVRLLATLILMVGGPLVLALVVIMNRHNLAQKKYEKIEKALESGRSPEEVERMMKIMETPKPLRRNTGFFRAGFIVIGLSLASLVVGLIIDVEACLASAGGGLVFGLALVAVWYMMDRNSKTA